MNSNPFAGFKDKTIHHHIHSEKHGAHEHSIHGSRWERLQEFHTVFLVDDSPSMDGDWAETMAFLREVVPECLRRTQQDISFFFTNHWTGEPSRYDGEWQPEWPAPSGYCNVKYVTKEAAVANGYPEEASAEAIFEYLSAAEKLPEHASTKVSKRLGQILRPYAAAYKAGTGGDETFKQIAMINLIVVTNGVDQKDLKTETLKIAEDLIECGAPTAQVGIQFVQVGTDKACTQMLKDLDSDMIAIDRDMIDTVIFEQTKDPRSGRMTEDGFFKVLLGGVSRKVDSRRLENGHFKGRS